jgi:hypothetical protein
MTLAVVAVLLNAGTVWLWPRLRGSRVVVGLTRTALLTATQLGLALTVLVALNSYFVFFAGWDDLLGTSVGGKPIKTNRATVHGGPSIPLQQQVIPMGKATPPAHPEIEGDIQYVRLHGVGTGMSTEAYIMLPPQYFQPAYAHQRFPAVVMLTGYPGNPQSLLKVLHFPNLVREGQDSGRVKPAVYVLMRPTLLPPRDTECTDVPAGPQVESFFAEDVPRSVSSHYRVATDARGWAIMGDSTGGYCAVKIAMDHSDRYSAAVSLSGYFHSLEDITTGSLYGGSTAIKDGNDLIWRMEHRPPPPISVLVTSCRQGERTYPQAVQFLNLAKQPLRADSLILDSGGHNFRTFGRMVPGALQWLSNHLQGY